ncbi:saccharopine dehydrogenase family protein [Novosphingopyxis sp.]|uniref:saccharopine dehydrogenase family protein n=1 Tax=Novosphingopyxis sp. TaxID=2709690 RepID=UPI003B5BFB99
MSEREFDIVVYGASGFTGRLVAEYLVQAHGASDLKWAMAGRSLSRLEAVRDAIGAPADTVLITADAADPASLGAMCKRTSVVITTVGPYQLYGNELVAACAATGTDYCDLCGEPAWMREQIDLHGAAAARSGARIVFSCGFDSIPFDLGVLMLQHDARAAHGAPAPRVKGRVRAMEGGFSGGTAASMKATMAAAAKDPKVIKRLTDPFSLTPGFDGPDQPAGLLPHIDDALDSWVAPFIMAAINTKNVHRTNQLLGHPYGEDFRYDEMVVTSPGEMGRQAAEMMAKVNPLAGDKGPRPGEGPSKQERDDGYYDLLFIGEYPDGRSLRYGVKGDRDPGYGSTSRMIAETAILLSERPQDGDGGVWTPGALLGQALAERLQQRAGLTFAAE